VACMEEGRGAYRVVVGRPEGKSHLEDLGLDGRIMLQYYVVGEAWPGLL